MMAYNFYTSVSHKKTTVSINHQREWCEHPTMIIQRAQKAFRGKVRPPRLACIKLVNKILQHSREYWLHWEQNMGQLISHICDGLYQPPPLVHTNMLAHYSQAVAKLVKKVGGWARACGDSEYEKKNSSFTLTLSTTSLLSQIFHIILHLRGLDFPKNNKFIAYNHECSSPIRGDADQEEF